MSTKNERLQQIWHYYDANKDHKPTSTREAVEWAVKAGLLALPEIDPYDVLASQMSNALRNLCTSLRAASFLNKLKS